MSHRVISRKFRPQTFTDVVGQEHITKCLINSIRSEKVAHAYIFSGPRGVGKTTVARILAKAINCEVQDSFEPCNICPSCIDITEGRDLDVIEIDGASNRGIDEIRSLRERILLAPVRGRYKVYIIDEVHMLTTEAFNALLKTLEEPPPYVVFIFATTQPNKVPPTIMSRCLHFQFRRIPVAMIVRRLSDIAETENIEIDGDVLYYIARKSEGCMRDAESLLEQIVAFSDGKITMDFVSQLIEVGDFETASAIAEKVLSGNTTEALSFVRQFSDRGGSVVHLYDDIVNVFHKLMLIKSGIKETEVLNISDSQLNHLIRLAEGSDISNIYTCADSLISVKSNYLRSVSVDIVLDMAIIRASRMVIGLPIDDLELLGIEGIIEGSLKPETTKERGVGALKSNEGLGIASSIDIAKRSEISQSKISKSIENERGVSKVSGDTTGVGDLWSRLLSEVKDRSRQLWGILNDAEFLGVGDGILKIGIGRAKRFHIERLGDAQNKVILSDAYEKMTGDRVDVEIVIIDGGDEEKKESKTGSNVVVDKVIEREVKRFGGRLISDE
ncbi:MAG: DNA polymerase III subunit gamma/tau [bacterium]